MEDKEYILRQRGRLLQLIAELKEAVVGNDVSVAREASEEIEHVTKAWWDAKYTQ